MKVTFGVHLDTGVWPHPLSGRHALAGETVVGPEHFLELLETHLGLGRLPVADCLRVSAFRKTLARNDDGDRFYSRSFEADPWGVAETLLAWQDELVEAGWDGQPLGTGRLQALTSLPPPQEPGRPERVERVTERLQRRNDFIEALTLADPPESFSPSWQRLLRAWGRPLEQVSHARKYAHGDLGRLQRWEGGAAGDGSVALIRGSSPWEAAEMVAAWLAASPSFLEHAVVVCEARGDILDTALRRYGLPCLGSTRSSPFRPATQVLPLLLSLRWKPLDPYRLLEFLKLPRTPLPLGRHALAQSLQEAPGVGGPIWLAAWEKAAGMANGDKLEIWLKDMGRHDRSAGMPVSEVMETTSQVIGWVMSLLSVPELRNDEILQAAGQQAGTLRTVLEEWEAPVISASHLDRLLADVTGLGTVSQLFQGEVGRLCRVAAPGAVLGPADTIIWWNFVDKDTASATAPWTRQERTCLSAAGLSLQEVRQGKAWLRPIKWARHRLLMASWSGQGHDPVRCHPLLDEIQVRWDISKAVVATSNTSLLTGVRRVELTPRSVQRPLQQWRIAPGLVARRPVESASSIETLIECPLRWSLTYAAKLRSRVLAGIDDDVVLAGKLAHAVIEHVLSMVPRPDPDVAMAAAGQEFDRLVPIEAGTLLLPSRTTWRLMLREATVRSAASLLGRLDREVEGVEVQRAGQLAPDLAVEGRLDVLMRDPPAVIDLKWSPRQQVRKLRAGTAIQLAVYAAMVDTDTAGYFSIRDGRFHVPPGTGWPAHPVAGPTLKETRTRVVETWRSRMGELESGHIEATGHREIERDTVDGKTLILKPPCRNCEYAMFCGIG